MSINNGILKGLELVPPEPVPCPVSMVNKDGKEVHRTVLLRPFTLRDEKWRAEIVEKYNNPDVTNPSHLIEPTVLLFEHQIYKEDRAWICEQAGVEEDKLFDYLMDQPSNTYTGATILSAVDELVKRSHPEGGEVDRKKLRLVSRNSMRWHALLWLVVGKALGILSLYILGRYVNLSWLIDGIAYNSTRMTGWLVSLLMG